MTSAAFQQADRTMQLARECWFSAHKATVKNHDGIIVVDWRKPGTNVYSVRYVFDGQFLYISGDLGEAVFHLTWEAKPDGFRRIDIAYLHEKLAAIHNNNDLAFDGQVAQNAIREAWLNDNRKEWDEDEREIIDEMLATAFQCDSSTEWAHRIGDIDWQRVDPDAFEWIYSCGDVYHPRFIAYLVGLQMITEQLTRSKEKGEQNDGV